MCNDSVPGAKRLCLAKLQSSINYIKYHYVILSWIKTVDNYFEKQFMICVRFSFFVYITCNSIDYNLISNRFIRNLFCISRYM